MENEKFDEVLESGFFNFQEMINEEYSIKIDNLNLPSFSDSFGKPVHHFKNIIISDIHLGSKISQTEMLITFLKNISFDRLIINGDVFDSINMKRLKKDHWKILSVLRKLTEKHKHKEVIWIRGNHDGFSDLLTQLLGIQVFNEYMFEWNGKNVLVLHGDIFDVYTSKHPILSEVADIIYKTTIYIDPVKNRIGKFLKKNTKAFLRNTQIVRERAFKYAKHKKADIVCCGHTHAQELIEKDEMTYINSGCWTMNPSHFIGFTENEVKVVPFSKSDEQCIKMENDLCHEIKKEIELIEEEVLMSI